MKRTVKKLITFTFIAISLFFSLEFRDVLVNQSHQDVVSFIKSPIQEEYTKTYEKLDKRLLNYNLTSEEFSFIYRNRGREFNMQYIKNSRHPALYNVYNESLFYGMDFMLNDLLENLLDIKFHQVDVPNYNYIVDNVKQNNIINGRKTLFASSLLRSQEREEALYMYDQDLIFTEIYAYVNRKSKYMTPDFDLQDYLVNMDDPLVAFVGSKSYRDALEPIMPNAIFFRCDSLQDAFEFENKVISPMFNSCFREYNGEQQVLSQLIDEFVVDERGNITAASAGGKPLVVISGSEDTNPNLYPESMLIDYYLVNDILSLPRGTFASNKDDLELRTYLDIICKIFKHNYNAFTDYRAFLYETVHISNVQNMYKHELALIKETGVKVGYIVRQDYDDRVFSPFTFAIINKVTEEHNIPIEYRAYPSFAEILNALEIGEIDMTIEVSRSSKGSLDILYSQPYLRSQFVLVGDANKMNVVSISSISHQKIAYSKIQTPGAELDAVLKLHKNVVETTSRYQSLQNLVNDTVDYSIVDEDFYTRFINVQNQYGLKVVHRFNATNNIGFAFAKHKLYGSNSDDTSLQRFFTSSMSKQFVSKIVADNYPKTIDVAGLLKSNSNLIVFLSVLIIFVLVLSLGSVIIIVTSYKKTNRILKNEITYDFLTGCKTRKILYDDYITKKANTFLFIDLDKFKNVNDTYGHDVGDDVLKHIASLLKKHFGRDNCYRIGGDEFIILSEVKEQISNIDKLLVDINKGYKFDDKEIRVDLSIGCSHDNFISAANDIDIKEALMVLDKAMYEAKSGATDSVVLLKKEDVLEHLEKVK